MQKLSQNLGLKLQLFCPVPPCICPIGSRSVPNTPPLIKMHIVGWPSCFGSFWVVMFGCRMVLAAPFLLFFFMYYLWAKTRPAVTFLFLVKPSFKEIKGTIHSGKMRKLPPSRNCLRLQFLEHYGGRAGHKPSRVIQKLEPLHLCPPGPQLLHGRRQLPSTPLPTPHWSLPSIPRATGPLGHRRHSGPHMESTGWASLSLGCPEAPRHLLQPHLFSGALG
jgi:hypothetical protein